VPFTVTGPSCDSSDTTFFGVHLPATLDAGDRLYIGSAGAYTLSYASHFNGFPPPSPVFIGAVMTRLRRLIGTALVDSFGLSLGWTVFSLYVVGRHGLAGLGLCNAAMLVGVALSAPVAARLSVRLDGRALLRVTCVTESVLRVGTFALLLAGAPLVVVAVAVAASNVVAWTGYAGMRAEVAAADPRGAAMTWYMVAVAAIEAAGTATAALLPRGPDGLVTGSLLFAVITCYGACLLPTWLVAGGARVGRVEAVGRAENGAGVGVGPVALPRAGVQAAPPAGSLAGALTGPLAGLLASGGLVMLLGSGPTLLAVGLAAELHGTRWVAGSALAFAAGSLLAPLSVARLERRALPPAVAWPALGVGMVAGWAFAAWRPAALLAAQFLSGMCMSALEGDMDARVAAGNPSPQGVTASLATAAALRAFGSAAAVALAPRIISEAGISGLSVALVTLLLAAMVITLAWHRSQSSLPRTGPAAHLG
jgi:hypothetical protein